MWRLIVDGAHDGAWNMAVDEALLERYAADAGPASDRPTLRLYGWAPPTLSLGRHQAAAGAHDPAWLRREGVDLVRRPSGGRAVLHERERTYAVIGRTDRPPLAGGVDETYRTIARAIARGLRVLGVDAAPRDGLAPADPGPHRGHPSCFVDAGRHEIVAGGRKLVGSAQLRRGRAVLQHGAIPIAYDAARVAAAIGAGRAGDATDLERELGSAPSPGAVDAALLVGAAIELGVGWREQPLDEREALLAQRLRCWRYDSASWTLDGRDGDAERRHGPPLGWRG